MQRAVHIEALRAATRVAFALTLLAGCSAASEEESASTDSDLKTKKASEDSCHASTDASADVAVVDASTPVSCEALVASAFPTEGSYPGTKKNVSKEVQSCCVEVLKSRNGFGAHRWDCCANATPGADIGLACTPWGPPVPPSMTWREVA